MDVDHASRKAGWDADEVQEARHDHEIGATRITGVEDGLAEIRHGNPARRNHAHRHPGMCGDFHTADVLARGDHSLDRRREPARCDPLQQIVESAA